MKGYSFAILLLVLFANVVHSQYWFQFGARSGQSAYYNTGAKVTVQTLTNQTPMSGSIAYWVGENLANGAFLQVGYLITNRSGLYPSFCTASGCSQRTYLAAGSTEWFYEYFTSGSLDNVFMGAIGPNDSVGAGGSLHSYGFYSKGNTWYFFMDNQTLGSVDLGTNNSGANGPVAFAEVANSSNPDTFLKPVVFSNLSFLSGGTYLPVVRGYSYIGYGVGSASTIPNPYGVAEIQNKVNYFGVGSGLPHPSDGTELWQLGFNLNIHSEYGNISGTSQYLAYHDIILSAPNVVYLNTNSRATFSNWSGEGLGSYSGSLPEATITMFGNVTEIANWNLQYLLNLSSELGKTSGSGWHNANSIVNYSVNSSDIYLNSATRWNFSGWSNGETSTRASLRLSQPYSINATWGKQYFLNVSSPFGGIVGAGWKAQNSTAVLSLTILNHSTGSNTRQAFYSWSNGSRNASLYIHMSGPVFLSAIFLNQSKVNLLGTDAYGNPVYGEIFNIDGMHTNGSIFLFNKYLYNLSTASYKGATLGINMAENITGPSNITVQLPIYRAEIRTTDIFGIPVNVPVRVKFANGTSYSGYSGQSGRITFFDVPYGQVYATANYGGEAISATSSMGAIAKILVISDLDIAVFVVILIVAGMGYLLISHSLRHRNIPKSNN